MCGVGWCGVVMRCDPPDRHGRLDLGVSIMVRRRWLTWSWHEGSWLLAVVATPFMLTVVFLLLYFSASMEKVLGCWERSDLHLVSGPLGQQGSNDASYAFETGGASRKGR
jgi:hypothetical protein